MIEKHKKIRQLLLFCLPFIFVFAVCRPVYMDTKSADQDKVLLVYDSKNATVQGDRKIASMQRLLSSLGLASQTVRAREYHAGQLENNHYRGTILLINWPEADLASPKYLKDLQNFMGVQVQIGGQLSANQLSKMHLQQNKIFQQQLMLQMGKAKQQLPFASSLNVLTNLPANAQTFGTLSTQSDQQRTLPFGVSVGKLGYLPTFTDSGLSIWQTAAMLSQLFERTTTNHPLLTITGINPYTNLDNLDNLTKKLHDHGYSFALSVSTTVVDSREAAFYRYATVLRRAQQRGGIIFMHVPYIRQLTAESRKDLINSMQDSVVGLGQAGIVPIGYSSPQFWQQNKVLRTGTAAADTLLLLRDPQRQKVQEIIPDSKDNQQTDNSQYAFFAANQSSLRTVENQADIKFAVPTALTVKMPNSKQHVTQLVHNLKYFDLAWYDPVKEQLQTQINLGSVNLAYQSGHYFINGRQTKVQDKLTHRLIKQKVNQPKHQLDQFFELGSSVLVLVFIVVFLILMVFLLVGRKVYREMFMKK